jgi:hypothetical protein
LEFLEPTGKPRAGPFDRSHVVLLRSIASNQLHYAPGLTGTT